jgi:AcrR family transcriptional regulator
MKRRPEPRPQRTAVSQKRPPAQGDGRLQRGERARQVVLDALLALLAEGNYAPSMQQISERAGVSRRLVFHHFKDAESMHGAFVMRQQQALQDFIQPIPETLPLATRLIAIVEQRCRVYETITHTRRAGLLREYIAPRIAMGLRAFRALKRAQIEQIFAPEIRSCHESAQREIASALSCAGSWNTWESLRGHQQLSVDEAQRVLIHMLTGILRLTPAGANLVVLRGAMPASS